MPKLTRMNKRIKVNLKEKSYEIFVENNILSKCGLFLKSLNLGKKILIVSQNKIPSSYIKKAVKSLNKNGFKVYVLILPSGEKHKNLSSLLKIVNAAIKNSFERNDSFCALGGGVVSDLTGFGASIYFRGINFISMPTTLLGMTDAAIGGKTSINISQGKNLLGTFYQPKIVLIDPICLKTLPRKEYLTGLAEVIKYGLLEKTAKKAFSKDGFFNYLKRNKNNILKLQSSILFQIITYSAALKAHVVSKDERESNLRAILNLGHTFAHGIEQAYDYKKFTHGEAVSIGMCLASRLAQEYNLFPESETSLVIKLISDFGLPVKVPKPVRIKKIIKAMLHDKKVKDNKLRFILPKDKIGKVQIISGIPLNKVRSLIMGF